MLEGIHMKYSGKCNKCSLEIPKKIHIKTVITVTRTQEIHNLELQFVLFVISKEGSSMAHLT